MNGLYAITGHLKIHLTDAAGNIIEQRSANNAITDEGRALLARLFCGKSRIDGLKVRVAESLEALSKENSSNEVVFSPPEIDTREQDGKKWAIIKVAANFPKLAETASNQNITAAGIVLSENLKDETQTILYNRVEFPVLTRTNQLDMTLGWEIKF